MTESLEALISQLQQEGKACEVFLGIPKPHIVLTDNNEKEILYLDDAPRLRQLYHSHHCFRSVGVRLDSLNFALQYLRKRSIPFSFKDTVVLFHTTLFLSFYIEFIIHTYSKETHSLSHKTQKSTTLCASEKIRPLIYFTKILLLRSFFSSINKGISYFSKKLIRWPVECVNSPYPLKLFPFIYQPIAKKDRKTITRHIQNIIKDFENEYDSLNDVNEFQKNMYNPADDSIDILYNDGSTTNIAEASDMLHLSVLSKKVKKYYICYLREKK